MKFALTKIERCKAMCIVHTAVMIHITTIQNKTCVLAHRDDDDNDLDAKSVSIFYHSVVSYSFIFRWFLNEIYLK